VKREIETQEKSLAEQLKRSAPTSFLPKPDGFSFGAEGEARGAAMIGEDVLYLSVAELGSRIRSRKLSPVELTEGYLDRIGRIAPG